MTSPLISDEFIPDKVDPWRVHGTTTAFRNRWLTVQIDQVELPTGETYDYTRVEPPAVGVGVVGLNKAGEVLLEREYRHGVGQVIWQMPGGYVDADESLARAALRELHEETGYIPRGFDSTAAANDDDLPVDYLGALWDNPALGPATSHIFLARDLVHVGDGTLDQAEFVTLHWQTTDWIREAIRKGEIQDRFVLGALAHLSVRGLI